MMESEGLDQEDESSILEGGEWYQAQTNQKRIRESESEDSVYEGRGREYKTRKTETEYKVMQQLDIWI
ncbi:hypothetical protein QQF64_013543 [Cirrhinus molitorella]|uniref:Uncharacterized protein n=1 Tax=Cirrhinus molitorella TaxID=172907 RepID=A0ABR3LRG7_9TELE